MYAQQQPEAASGHRGSSHGTFHRLFLLCSKALLVWLNVWRLCLQAYPWGANLLPEDRKLAEKLTGNYNGPAGDQTPVPDFYDTYAVGHQKPMALAETAAMFNTQADATVDAYHMKVKWLEQVSSLSLARDALDNDTVLAAKHCIFGQ